MLNLLVFLVRGGCTTGFTLAYYITENYTPVSVLATTFAITNIVARFFTILAPISADLMANPMILSTVFACAAFIASFWLDKNHKDLFQDSEEIDIKPHKS